MSGSWLEPPADAIFFFVIGAVARILGRDSVVDRVSPTQKMSRRRSSPQSFACTVRELTSEIRYEAARRTIRSDGSATRRRLGPRLALRML